MREISTEIMIEAPPERIWAVLTDHQAMPSWNPFIRSMIGSLEKGERMDVVIAPPGRRPMRFRPVLLVVDPARELRWRGSLGVPGLFDGEHSFRLELASPARTCFRQGERFSGLLVPLVMRGALLDATRQGFTAMNVALKLRVEARS